MHGSQVNQATIYAPPTVVDLDMDGVLDVIVGTGLGFLYVLSGDTGKLRRGFPVEMGPIQAGVACGDLLGDGSMAIVACDTLGNVAAFNAGARVQWSQFVCNSQSCMFFQLGLCSGIASYRVA